MGFSSKVIPLGLGFSFAKDLAMVAMQIFNISNEIMCIENQVHATAIDAICIAGCQWYNLASSYLIN